MNKYLFEKSMLLGFVFLLLLADVGCNEIGMQGAASYQDGNELQTRMVAESLTDSVNFIILNGIAFDSKGKIIESRVKESVHDKIQSLPSGLCFLEISANYASEDWFLFNLEAVRREFVRQGLDPVLVSTHKKVRFFPQEKKPAIGFTVVSAGS